MKWVCFLNTARDQIRIVVKDADDADDGEDDRFPSSKTLDNRNRSLSTVTTLFTSVACA